MLRPIARPDLNGRTGNFWARAATVLNPFDGQPPGYNYCPPNGGLPKSPALPPSRSGPGNGGAAVEHQPRSGRPGNYTRNIATDITGFQYDNRRPSTCPSFGGGDLVADALAGDLALELGEGQQDVEGQPAHRGGGIELLGDGDERDALRVEQLDDLGEVGQRAGQPVDLVDHDDVDAPSAMSASSRCSAGRSMVPPEKPPSS